MYSSLFPPTSEDAAKDPPYKLQSVKSLLAHGPTVPLTLAITTFSAAPSARQPPRASVSCVVTSTALHAAILDPSESLRASHPGIERFKLAAAQNATRWYNARLRLLPSPATSEPPSDAPAPVLQYAPPLGQFIAAPSPPAATGSDAGPTAALELAGPFG